MQRLYSYIVCSAPQLFSHQCAKTSQLLITCGRAVELWGRQTMDVFSHCWMTKQRKTELCSIKNDIITPEWSFFMPLTDLLSLSRNTEPLLSQRASLTGDKQNGEEKVSESEPMVLSRLTSSDSSQEPSSPSSEGSCCWLEDRSAPASPTRLWLSVEVLLVMFLSSSSSSSWAAGWRECGLEGNVGIKHTQHHA